MKVIPFTAALVLAAAGMAQAENSFSLPMVMMTDGYVELPVINADAAGVIEVYDYNTDQIGALLGTMPVNAGANENVKITIHGSPFNDVIAQLKIDGQVVAEQVVEFTEN